MNFLEKHLLFPKRFGISPYFWLFCTIPVVGQLLPLDSLNKWFFILLLLIFLKAYRDGYEVQKYLSLDILLQLIIACLFGIFQKSGYLFILTAWEIGSLPIEQTLFRKYLLSYYLFATSSLAFMLFTIESFNLQVMVSSVIATVAAFASPFVAKATSNSYRRIYQLSQQNKRLESIIRQSERERIARDLHDNLEQAFSIITIKAELADKLIAVDLTKTKHELADIADMSRKNLTLVRSIVADLQERTIAKTMLEEEKNLILAKINLQSTGEELVENWPIKIQNTLSAIIKEAVTNMIRHSQASLAMIDFIETTHCYMLKIKDNGCGFTKIREDARGITGMKQRIQAEKGMFQIQVKDGTEILIHLSKELTDD